MKGRVLAPFLLLSALPVFPAQLCVEVTDPDGLALPEAAVSLVPTEERAVTVGLTDESGRFCMDIASGMYTLKVSFEGLLGDERTLTVLPEEDETIPVTLRLAAISDRVQVTASRIPQSLVESPIPVRQITREEVEQLSARHMGDVLQEQASVVSFAGGSHSGGNSFNVDGFQSEDVQLLIDGQPLIGRVSGYIDMSEIDSGIVEAVEVRPGASSVMYGSEGMGGAINIVTRRATSGYQLGAEAGFGSFNTGLSRLDGGFSSGGFAAYMAAYGMRSLGYDMTSEEFGVTQSPERQMNLFGSFYLPPIKRLSLGLTTMYFGKRFWGYDQGSSVGIYDFERPRQRLVVIPRGSLPTSVNSLLSFRLRHVGIRRSETLNYRESGAVEIETIKERSQGAETEWNWMISGRHRLGLGVFFDHGEIDSDRISTADGKEDRDTYANFGVLSLKLRRDVTIDAGMRYDHDSIYGDAVSPQAAVAWHIAEPWSLSFSTARGFRAPGFNELYVYHSHAGGRVVVIGNPELTPQYSWSYSLSSLLRLGRAGNLETRLFRHDMEDLIDSSFIGRQGTASIYQYQNIGEAISSGVSITYRGNFNRSWDVSTGYQLLSTNNKDEHTPLEYSPRHRFTFRAGYRNAKAGLTVTGFGNLTGDAFFGESSGERDWMERFELIGFTATKSLYGGLSLRATFRNLSDNVDPDYRITAPRSAEIALIYSFRSE